MNGPRFDRQAKIAFVVACATMLVCGITFRGAVLALNLYLKKESVPVRAPLALIPTTIGDWKTLGRDRTLDSATLEALGTDTYLDRTYGLENGATLDALYLHVAYYTGTIDTVPHVPDRCLVAAGYDTVTLPENLPLNIDRTDWIPDRDGLKNLATGDPYQVVYARDVSGRLVPVRMPVGDFKLRTVQFEDKKHPEVRIFGGYFFIANGRMTPTPEGVKAMAFDPREKYAYYCKVQYVYASREATQEKFLSLTAGHLQKLLPELMQCLPDWAEVERRDNKPDAKPQA